MWKCHLGELLRDPLCVQGTGVGVGEVEVEAEVGVWGRRESAVRGRNMTGLCSTGLGILQRKVKWRVEGERVEVAERGHRLWRRATCTARLSARLAAGFFLTSKQKNVTSRRILFETSLVAKFTFEHTMSWQVQMFLVCVCVREREREKERER